MSDNDKENVHSTSDTGGRSSRFYWLNIGILLSGITASILIMVIIYASYALLAVNHQFSLSLTELTHELTADKENIAEAEKNATNALQGMQQTNDAVKAQSQAIIDLEKAARTNNSDFLIAEASHLVRMANDSLQYEGNIALAIKLLQAADQTIAKLSDPSLYPVRKALATDLSTLKSAPLVDISGVYARLVAFSEQINKLSFIANGLNNTPQIATETNNKETLPWWRRGLNSIQLALQRIVIVRKNLPHELPFMTPDQQFFLLQNLQAELEKAEWGLLHREQDVYRLSLAQANHWIVQYAGQNAPLTKQLLQELQQLQQIDVHPNVPSVTHSFEALQNVAGSKS